MKPNRSRDFLVVSVVVFLLLAPVQLARADIMPSPLEYTVFPAIFWAFVVFVVAAFSRLLLLFMKGAARRIHGQASDERIASAREGRKWYFTGKLERRAALLTLIIAVPFYYRYGYEQALERRRLSLACRSSKVKSYLGAIRSTEVAYYAEWSVWVGNQPPTPIADRRGNKEVVEWDRNTRFSIIGFEPEGKVCCSYSLEGPDWPTAEQGFTARAECDTDRDGLIAVYWVTSRDTEIRHSGAPF